MHSDLSDVVETLPATCVFGIESLQGLRPRHPFTGAAKLPHRCFEINYQIELFKLYGIPDDARITYAGREAQGVKFWRCVCLLCWQAQCSRCQIFQTNRFIVKCATVLSTHIFLPTPHRCSSDSPWVVAAVGTSIRSTVMTSSGRSGPTCPRQTRALSSKAGFHPPYDPRSLLSGHRTTSLRNPDRISRAKDRTNRLHFNHFFHFLRSA